MKEPKHPLAILRRTIGLRQREMAELLECSLPTIQAIEYGHLKLSDKLAQSAAQKTGVSASWLRAGCGPIVDNDGKPYTRETYDKYHQMMFAPSKHPVRLEFELKLARSFFLMAMERMAILFGKALREKNVMMCHFKVSSATEKLLSELGTYKSLSNEENDSWRYAGWIPDKTEESTSAFGYYEKWIGPRLADSVGGEQILAALNRFLESTDAIHQEHLKNANPPAAPPRPKKPRARATPESDEMNRPLPYSPPRDQNFYD